MIIAEGRAKRPHQLGENSPPRVKVSKDNCPFEDLNASGNQPIAVYPGDSPAGEWKIAVIPNKYPALQNDPVCPVQIKHDLYTVLEGKGHHELIITRDHDKDFNALDETSAAEVLLTAKSRYEVFDNDPCVAYVSLFHLWGPGVGASIYHPHYQMLGLPVLPPEVEHSILGSKKFFEENKICVHCAIIENELKEGKRIVFENEGAVAMAPFASRQPFEVRIFPKKHENSFSKSGEDSIRSVAQALREVISRMKKNLADPDYMFFLHSSPAGEGDFSFYHWHLEILPKTTIFGGLEWETGIIVNIVDPDSAALALKQ